MGIRQRKKEKEIRRKSLSLDSGELQDSRNESRGDTHMVVQFLWLSSVSVLQNCPGLQMSECVCACL